jgi:hypothetical protein
MSAVHLTLDQQLAFDRALGSMGFERDALAFDRQTLRKFDVDGRMHVERCNISKANVCPYFGREIPGYDALGLEPNRIYRLYRDPAELERGAATFRNLQLLMYHTAVNAADAKTQVTVGCIGSDVSFERPYLTASIAVWTDEAIKLIESKQQAELSCSYRYRADMTPGVTPEGVAYDGVMRDIMGNHVALVEKGRAGPDVYVSDSHPLELPKMKRPHLVAAVAAALGAAVALTEDQKLALDAAMCKADDEAEEEKKKKKAAEDASAAVTPGPKEGEKGKSIVADAAAMDAAIRSHGFITKADAERLANDAAASAVAAVNALHKAREDVKPLVGVVAMDSAEAVYRFALTHEKVALDGVPPAAFGALVEQVKARKAGTPVVVQTPKLAADAANAAAAAIPGLGRFQVA